MPNPADRTPTYVRYLAPLIRPFPNFDFFFIKPMRQRAVTALHLQQAGRALDVGCGPGGTFPYLVQAVGTRGEVVGVELSPEVAINARSRIQAKRWNNVQVIEGDARTVTLNGTFDGLIMFAAPDVYASPDALKNLFPYLNANARVAVFGGKLSGRRSGRALNPLLRAMMKLSHASTPQLELEPWRLLEPWLTDIHVEEYCFGTMFLASGVYSSNHDHSSATA